MPDQRSIPLMALHVVVGNRLHLVLAACLLVVLGVRLMGLTRGATDFVAGGPTAGASSGAFYRFHPDEETIIKAALHLDDPLAPPSTAYGPLTLYTLRLALEAAQVWGWGDKGLETTASARQVYIVARCLAAVYGLLGVLLTYAVGRQFMAARFAWGAAVVFGLVPLAVQQAHFYTADGLLTGLVLGFFWCLGRALRQGGAGRYLACGACIGLAGATRLYSLELGGIVLCGLVLVGRGGYRTRWAEALRRPPLWLAAGAAVAVLAAMQPYLLVDPFLEAASEFAHSMDIARGRMLAPWSLVDIGTLPYVHYWTHLWPQAVGWPLTGLLAAGWAFALWRPTPERTLIALWCLAAFLTVGGLHTKHVRYLMPQLPFLCLLAADLTRHLWACRRSSVQRALKWVPLACAVWGGLYGVAFARAYGAEDSRIRAARWIEAHIPAGRPVGLEGGGFSMRGLISPRRYLLEEPAVPRLFYLGPYLLCELKRDHLHQYFRGREYFVALDVNRYRQFTRAPGLFPVVAGTYERLFAGELGFDQVADFDADPRLGPLHWDMRGAEPSFVGYDRPRVRVFRRRSAEAVDRAFGAMALSEQACADGLLAQAAKALVDQDPIACEKLVGASVGLYPYDRLAFLIGAEALQLQGRDAAAAAMMARSQPVPEGPLAHLSNAAMVYLIPWAAGRSLIELGLEDLGLRVLRFGAEEPPADADKASDLAHNYQLISQVLVRRQRTQAAAEVLGHALRLSPSTGILNALAGLALMQEDADAAKAYWYRSLQLWPEQPDVYRRLGRLLAKESDGAFIESVHQAHPRIARGLAEAVEAAKAVRQKTVGRRKK